MQKQVQFKTVGMQRDLSESAFNPKFAYENKNIRITPTDDNTLFSITNEKGNISLPIEGIGDYIEGTPIGQAIIANEWIVFTTGDKDTIYKLWFEGDTLKGTILYSGDLNFSVEHTIETLIFYENDDIKKVYWVDGLNQPRVINIAATEEVISKWNDRSFDFVASLELKETVNIKRNLIANGVFAPGVIQYVFTYYNKYGQESNVFYSSSLYYVSFNNRGASSEDKVSNSFDIEISGVDKSFDYLRIYSIHRTSIDAVPEVKRVVDLPVTSSTETLSYTDSGTAGDFVDPTELLYVGGEEVIFGTLAQKDNTLFLGDFTLKRRLLDSSIRDYFKGKTISFNTSRKSLTPPEPSGYYPYNNQLKLNSQQIKTFKYLEYYRFGIQAQHYTGRWSEPIWINDVRNTEHINTTFYNNSDINLPVAEFDLSDSNIISKLVNQGYVKIRPLVVFPNINDREVICQGILCPTVYNVGDRYDNAPFVQSSWFARPNAPYDVDKAKGFTVYTFWTNIAKDSFVQENYYTIDGNKYLWYDKRETDTIITKILLINDPESNIIDPPTSGTAIGENNNNFNYSTYTKEQKPDDAPFIEGYDIYSRFDIMENTENVSSGSWTEFRHNYPIPDNRKRNAEIQCLSNPPIKPYVELKDLVDIFSSKDVKSDWVSKNKEYYYVDQSILTLHSPDIEFDNEIRSLDMSNLKLRIVGMVPLTSFISDIDIQTSTPTNIFSDGSSPKGFYKKNLGVVNSFLSANTRVEEWSEELFDNSYYGFRSLNSAPLWIDALSGSDLNNKEVAGFVVYPWHRNGSLNNTKFADVNGYKSALLSKKKMSNLRYSYKTEYLNIDNIWNAQIDGSSLNTGISSPVVFDSSENTLIRVPAPKYSKLLDINYYGNIDKIISKSTVDNENDYPIVVSGVTSKGNVDNSNEFILFQGNYRPLNSYDSTEQITSTDPVRIKYKSTPHAVIALNYTAEGNQRVLPTIQDGNIDTGDSWDVNYIGGPINKNSNSNVLFWDKRNKFDSTIHQDVIETGIKGNLKNIKSLQYGWFWLGELYNDNIKNRFGGQTEEAFENNQWLPCGDAISLIDENNNPKNSLIIQWSEGDTYYQRYDHIKTYPYTLEDQNSVTDIVSFMCETRVNIDGRYDRNRGQINNLTITPDSFNKINEVYSQRNNFFNYRIINPNKLSLDNFHHSITWTKTKSSGELVDTWTNITLASVLDLDGDKGSVNAIRRLNNNLIAFQNKGISQILYNENMQIASTEGVPIEIANSGKVSGKRYITDQIGCTNKWSICETPYGIYFVDDISKGIYVFDGKVNNITSKLGFDSWIRKTSKIGLWNPRDFAGFITYYDKTNEDVLFINNNECLAYSETLGQFTSFYNYESTPYLMNLDNKALTIHKDSEGKYKIWLQNGGDYNMFYGEYKPFYTTVIVNPDITKDKIFNNIEFRADSWNKEGTLTEDTFDTLKVWNEYQEGIADLTREFGRPSTLKKKFRIWRANIPRDKSNNRDRIRNPWVYVKLSKNTENTDKTVLHDMVVSYFE